MSQIEIQYINHPSTGDVLKVPAWSLDEETIDSVVPENISNGNYRIYERHENGFCEVIYVGRVGNRTSDAGLKCRLKEHVGEWSGDLFFDWNAQSMELFAYNRECKDYHMWKDTGQAKYNDVHPAKPKRYANLVKCQICKV